MTIRHLTILLALALAAAAAADTLAPDAERVNLRDPAPAEAVEPPPPHAAVLQALELDYLSEDERADRRVFHGLWRESDLEDPTRRATAALILGALDDPALDDATIPAELAAEARVRRGAFLEALERLEGVESARADRLRAQALEGLGRFGEATAVVERLVERLRRSSMDDAETVTELARGLRIRARLRGEPGEHYQTIVELLSRAHQKLDRRYWPAILEEADLLLEKSNVAQGIEAATDVLRYNPVCAEAWRLLGVWSVRSMQYPRAVGVAEHLDRLDRRLGGASVSSPYADVVRVRARLRQDDPDLAERYLAPTLARYPSMPEALALRCAVESIRYEPDRVERRLAEFDERLPGSPVALFEVASALSEARQYEMSAGYFRRAIERQPNWPEPHIGLGLLELQAGRDRAALEALEHATALDPFNVRARNSLKLIRELQTYGTLESDHFIVRYKPGIDAVLAREMLEPLDEMHRVVADAMGFEPDRKTVIELMPNHERFAVRITGNPSLYTMAASTGPVIAMEAPKIGKEHTTLYEWLRVARHEYTHTVTLARTKNRIPHWFTEAAAVHMELGPRDYDRCRLLAETLLAGELFDLEQINTEFVRPTRPSGRALAYAQAHWMLEFMLEAWGDEAPLEIMDGYAEGLREGELIERVLGIPAGEFLERFEAWAMEDVRAWGMAPEPSLEALHMAETLADEELASGVADELARHARSVAHAVAAGNEPAPFEPPMAPITSDLVEFWSVEHPDHPDVLRLRIEGELSRTEGEPTRAMIPLLERYAEARPVDPLPHRLLTRLLLRDEDRSRVIPHLAFLEEREVWSDTYAIELARRYADVGRLAEAMEVAERAVRINPFDPTNREVAARIAIGLGALDDAERHLLALTDLEPNRSRHEERLEALRRMRAAS
jgi:tetratricopeptide (TPR) repeat protein